MQDFVLVLAFVLGYVITRALGYAEMAMYVATACLMVASLAQLLYLHKQKKPIEKRQWLGVIVIWVLGGFTLILQNELLIKFKPTVIYTFIALAFTFAPWIGNTNLTQKMLGSILVLPERLWQRLNVAWIGFFLLLAVMNAYVALNFSNDFYVGFKFWGLSGAMLVFMLGQYALLWRYVKEEENSDADK